MSRVPINRRQFLTVLGLTLFRSRSACAQGQRRQGAYTAEVSILYDMLTFRLDGTIDEAIDRTAGRYDVRLVGQGSGIANRVESSGRWIDGRWAPVRTTSWFQVRGRESRSEIVYDHARRIVDYHFRGETFFRRHTRVVDDSVPVREAIAVDDVVSAMLNYADDAWKPDPDGAYRTHVVRRHKDRTEGPDDIDPHPHAELVPFTMTPERDNATGKQTGLFDMTRFSSWAREGRPARVVFGWNRRPELITSSFILGTSVTIRLRDA